MGSIKLSDIAKAAGVSTATASRALNNPDVVKADKRERILKLVDELNYQPNALARQLRTQSTKTIIVIIPSIENTFFREILTVIGTEAELHGYQMLIANLQSQPSLEKYYFEAIQQRQIDGIISFSANIVPKFTQQIAKKYPLVMAIQSIPSQTIPNVTVDNAAGTRALMTHLIRLGHRNIAHITSYQSTFVYHDRLISYISALEENGIPVDNDLIGYGEPTIMGGYEQMSALLAKKKTITAVFASDTMAIGAMKALKKHGLRIPEDCAVVGFDDIEISAFWEPALTTIRQPKEQIGRVTFQQLLLLMKKEPVPDIQVVLPFELVIRESCGYYL